MLYLRRRRLHLGIYGLLELREVLLEHADKLVRGLIERRLVGPGLVRVEQILVSMPGTEVGTAKPKYWSVRNSTFFSEPSSAPVTSARVTLIGMRGRRHRCRRSSRS